MPRKAKGNGYGNRTDQMAKGKTQAIAVASGQTYGNRQASEQSQRDMPLPGDPIANLMADTGTFDGTPTSLLAPTQRPDEPVTAGLTTGPGPGPEVLFGPSTKASDTFAYLAEQTGDSYFLQLAELSRRQGR